MSRRWTVYWTIAALVVAFVLIPMTVRAGLLGLLFLLPTIPAAPAVISTIVTDRRMLRELRRWADAGVRETDRP